MDSEPKTESGWIIERRGNWRDFLKTNDDAGVIGFWFDWTPLSDGALRFSRQCDAEKVLEVVAPLEAAATPECTLRVMFHEWVITDE